MRENTIGVVRWGALRADTDGERLLVLIPAFFQKRHLPYLLDVVRSRVAEIDDKIAVSLHPGLLTESPSGTAYDEGTIVLSDVSEPWPDAQELRAALDAAFVEAGEIEQEQAKLALKLWEHLRSADKPSP